MEEAIRRIRIFLAKDSVGEVGDLWVRFVIFEKSDSSLAGLVGADEEGLVFARGFFPGV